MPAVELTAVVDIKRDRAEEIAAKYGAPAFTTADSVDAALDAVIIAVPTIDHLRVAQPFIERGTAVLVEKPIAASVAEADALVQLADAHGVRTRFDFDR